MTGKWRNWYTRTTQNRVPYGLRVRFPPCPPKIPERYIESLLFKDEVSGLPKTGQVWSALRAITLPRVSRQTACSDAACLTPLAGAKLMFTSNSTQLFKQISFIEGLAGTVGFSSMPYFKQVLRHEAGGECFEGFLGGLEPPGGGRGGCGYAPDWLIDWG